MNLSPKNRFGKTFMIFIGQVVVFVIFALFSIVPVPGQVVPVPGFDSWTLSGSGRQVDQAVLEVSGQGAGSSLWTSKAIPVERNAYYRFRVSLKGVDSQGGCLPCGIRDFSRDYSARKDKWEDRSFCFQLQDPVSDRFFRLGQWESKGTFQFKNMRLEQVKPVLRQIELSFGTILLGEGEMINQGVYQFNGSLGWEGTNVHRPFRHSNTTFNSSRWCFGNRSNVLYHFQLPVVTRDGRRLSIPFDGGTLKIGVCYHARGEGVVEISRDGKTRWTELARLDKQGVKECTLPPIAMPLEEIHLRIRGLPESNFQVDRIALEAQLPKIFSGAELKHCSAVGETLFASCRGDRPTGNDRLALTPDDRLIIATDSNGKTEQYVFPLERQASPVVLDQTFEVPGKTYTLRTQTHPLKRSDYGYVLTSAPTSDGASSWWCEADWKVSRDRQPPKEGPGATRPIRIEAAKNDVEGFQYVLRAPEKAPITGLEGSVSALAGPNGATIPAENVRLLYAYYHFVHTKTDGTGLRDYWPDALPPLDRPIDVPAGKNQPLWINVTVPADAAPGDYRGSFRLSSRDGRVKTEVPFTVHVWNFALPEENHLETAFGFSPQRAATYHNAKSEEDRRRVVQMYLQCFSEHRISIYNPAPFDGISVEWLPEADPPCCEIDFSRYDAEMGRVLKQYHFTNFTVPGMGLGGGTFHARHEPSIQGFGEDTPQYKAMIADYYAKLQKHLEEKGWLDKTYIYWFDEPGKHDYDFVARGTAKLQRYAPKINRFMTLMMDDLGFLEALEKQETSIDIWCTVSNSFRDDLAIKRMDKGERFWWYICTGPKAPYCTLFIDHPATELRVWHWQAWQRNVVGTLVWESTYWSSGTAFPDGYQNPYEDPMGYVSGYSVPKGTKQPWGNGDGRFIYPPLRAAVPGSDDGKPVFDRPVTSIRWEMIREGVEDYEMLYLLRELLRKKGDRLNETERKTAEELLRVPDTISTSMTEFTIDPRPLLQRRNAIGAMIETLANR